MIGGHEGDEGDEQLASLASLALLLHPLANGLQARSANCFLSELAPAHLPGPMSCFCCDGSCKSTEGDAKCLHGLVNHGPCQSCHMFTILVCVWPSWGLPPGPKLT